MAFKPSNLKRHRRKNRRQEIKLSLTSMMDIFIVILLFLLKSYSSTEEIIVTDESFRLPVSESQTEPHPALIVKVNEEYIAFDGDAVANSPEVISNSELLIPNLYNKLMEKAERSKFISSKNESINFRGEIIIQGDKDIPFILLKKVMYTCSRAEFGNIALAVLQKDPS